jgi:hypothetical protein
MVMRKRGGSEEEERKTIAFSSFSSPLLLFSPIPWFWSFFLFYSWAFGKLE